MKSIFTVIIISICLSFHGIAQQANEVSPYQNQAAVSLDLFQKNSQQVLPNNLKDGLILDLQQSTLETIFEKDYLSVHLTIPSINGEHLELELVQRSHLAKNFKVRGSISGEIAVQLGKHYEGKVKGLPHSIATVNFSSHGVRVLISTPQDGNMVIGQMNRSAKSDAAYIFYKEKDVIDGPKFACQTPDFDPAFEPMPSLAGNIEKSAMCLKPIDVYLECDHLMYQDFGGDIQNITNYVIAIFHNAAALFRAEEVAIQSSEIFIWESPDPYTDDDREDALFDFRDHLNGNFNGRIAHLLSSYRDDMGFAANGGLAYINTFCSTTFAVGYNNLQLDFNGQVLPAESYDVVLLTHEIGHNLGSKHTHACVWGPNEDEALDDCFETEGDCPPGPTPVGGGTIMSYCHVTSNGLNLSEGFGQEPGDKIRQEIANASSLCLSEGTANFQASIQALGNTNIEEGGEVTLVGVPTSPDYYYQWYRDGELLPGIIFPNITVSTAGDYTVSIVHNGCTEVSSAVNVSVGSFEAAVFCSPDCSACVGQSIFLETNIAGATYEWSTGETTESIEVHDNGTYSVTVTNGSNSSVATTTVSFNQQSQSDNAEICEGDVYTIGDSSYDESGVYTDFITTNEGCLLEVTTNLTVTPAPQQSNIVEICEGESIQVGNSTYNETGIYVDLISNEENCLIEITTDLTVNLETEETIEVEICDGAVHIIDGIAYSESGTYTSESVNSNGCLHTTYTALTVLSSPNIQTEASICEGGSYMVGTSVYTEAGTYEDVLTGENGCDSTIITTLMIADNYEINLNATICEGGTYEFCGVIYDAPGTYTKTLVASDGCDSIINLDIALLPNVAVSIEMCSDDNTDPGVYTNIFSTSEGCDSIVTVTVHPTPLDVNLNASICTGQTYEYNGEILTETGTYEFVETDNNGCSYSTFVILLVSDEIIIEDEINLCFGALYEGDIYTESATITTNGTSITGCDSTHVLQLIVSEELSIEATFSGGSIDCDGDAGSVTVTVSGGSSDYSYLWSTGETSPILENVPFGEISLTVTDSEGCSLTETWTIEGTTQLAVNYEATMVACRGESTGSIDMTIASGTPPYTIFWSNGPLSEDNEELFAGDYTFFITDANGCSLDTTIVITEPATALVTETSVTPTTNNNDDGTASVTATGGNEPYTYAWSTGETTATIENLSADTYTVSITDANDCTKIEDVIVEQVLGLEDIDAIHDFSILPNPNHGLFSLHLKLAQAENISVEIYNVIGQRIEYFDFYSQNLQQNIDLQAQASGVYILVIKSDTWQLTERIVTTTASF